MDNTDLSTRRIFIQYINPEIISLYGWNHATTNPQLYRGVLTLTRYALLFSNDSIIMPASYLFEVSFMDRFLKDVDAVRAASILQFASPTSDLQRYASKKKQEYRDELVLFPGYKEQIDPPESRTKDLIWVPRTNRSSSADIAAAWKSELHKRDGIWRTILEKRAPQLTLLPSKLETDIESVPQKLQDRAFIARFVDSLLPIRLELSEQTQTSMLISRAYLESYLDELDALVLVDTPLGDLSCGLPRMVNGHLRTFSFRELREFFVAINLSFEIEHILRWRDLIRLRAQFVFRWLINLIIQDTFDTNRPFANAILKSRVGLDTKSGYGAGSRSVEGIIDRLNRLFVAVQPFLKNYSTEAGNVLEMTMPTTEQKPRRKRRRGGSGGSRMKRKQVLRIVVASPTDVKAERQALEGVIQELNGGIAEALGLVLELSKWETDAFPGFHPLGPQGLIDTRLKIEECEVLIGIFWRRFGTPTTGAQSGTEHEILKAYEAWKHTGKPQIMVYFNQKPYTPTSPGETEQWGRVLEFRRRFPPEGLWWLYNGKSEFEKLVRNHLTRFIPQEFS